MQLTSFTFFLVFALSLLIYYITPRKVQWVVLLAYSILFFCASSKLYTIAYLLVSGIVTGVCAKKITEARAREDAHRAKAAVTAGILVNAGMLALLKYCNFFITNVNAVMLFSGKQIPLLQLAAPLGISFYSLQLIGYLLDVYWGICNAQGSIFKTLLFAGYYPQLTSGPITRYKQMEEQLYCGHSADWTQIKFGLERILWGVFKKLVISTRAGILVDAIYADTATYNGFYIWVASALFMVQLYTDFSGCMDIILGVSECYGIVLPENFRTPFFSRSVQEYWQRWHITLGTWMKDYIMYPVLRSKAWRGMTKYIKAHFGKKAAKQIPAYLGMLCVWLLIGLWHGGNWKYVIGMGGWFWLCIVFAQVFEPAFARVAQALRLDRTCFAWHVVQSVRVFILVCIGNMFFRLSSLGEVLSVLKQGVSCWNPGIFVNGSLFELGLDRANVIVLLLGILVLFVVSAVKEKCDVREALERRRLAVRWICLFALIFGALVFGMYGVGYDAATFIYQAF